MESFIYYFKFYIEGFYVFVGEVYVVVEVLKGEFGVYLVVDGINQFYCVKICVSGYVYLQVCDYLFKGYQLVDVVVIIGIMDIVFGEIDC